MNLKKQIEAGQIHRLFWERWCRQLNLNPKANLKEVDERLERLSNDTKFVVLNFVCSLFPVIFLSALGGLLRYYKMFDSVAMIVNCTLGGILSIALTVSFFKKFLKAMKEIRRFRMKVREFYRAFGIMDVNDLGWTSPEEFRTLTEGSLKTQGRHVTDSVGFENRKHMRKLHEMYNVASFWGICHDGYGKYIRQ